MNGSVQALCGGGKIGNGSTTSFQVVDNPEGDAGGSPAVRYAFTVLRSAQFLQLLDLVLTGTGLFVLQGD